MCLCVCAPGVYSCLLSMIEDKTQSEIGEKDRPAEGGRYNLNGVCRTVCACKSQAKEVSVLECVFGVMKVFPAYACPALSLV